MNECFCRFFFLFRVLKDKQKKLTLLLSYFYLNTLTIIFIFEQQHTTTVIKCRLFGTGLKDFKSTELPVLHELWEVSFYL